MLIHTKKDITAINVAVCGSSGSGKSKLVEKLNGHIFTRDADRRLFRLTLTESAYESKSLFSDFDFALFTLDATGITGKWDKWKPVANIITENHPEHSSKTCLVGTKLDAIPSDSLQDIALQCLPAVIAYFARLKYISSSAMTGVGIQTVASHIADQLFPPPFPSTPWSVLLGALGSKLLDTLSSIFALPVPPNINQDTENTNGNLDDDAIEVLYQSPECMAYNAYLSSFGPKNALSATCPAYRITPSLIAKNLRPIEITNTVYARSRLNIPIPQPRYPHLQYWFVTDFIKGKSLLECWDTLGIYMQFRIACTLRTYVSQMRRLTQATPGSPVGGHVLGYLFSSGFYSGPFESAATFQRYIEEVTFEGWQSACYSYKQALEDGRPSGVRPEKPTFPAHSNAPLVFTHADISPSNLMLSDDGVLWVIDWATCGFYPKWMEAMGMYRYADTFPKSWGYLAWLAVGPPPKHLRFWMNYFLSLSDHYSSLDPGEQTIP